MRILFLLLMFFSLMNASENLEIKKGWQLIGIPTTVDIQKNFNNQNVEILWGFDAKNQSWKGYSPLSQKSILISQKYTTLTTLEPYQALWIFSKNDWILKYEPTESIKIPKNRIITLQIGWNLISIPQNIVVCDKFFGDALVWRYSNSFEWSVNDETLGFPKLESIKQSQGVWVKSDEVKNLVIDDESSKLSSFKSRDSMLSYIRKMLEINQHKYYYPNIDIMPIVALEDGILAPTNSEKLSSDATTTNLQEVGVDESDILKHDGVYIFNVDNANDKIIITSFENIAKNIYEPIKTIDFKDKNIDSIYLQNSRLIVIYKNQYPYILESKSARMVMPYPYNNNLTLEIFNINDIDNILKIASHTIDGYYQDSRLIDGELYLISQFSASLIDEKFTPMITTTIFGNETKKELVLYDRFYAPIKLNQSANITSITHFSIDSGEYKTNSAFLGNTHTYYASLTSLYLVSNEYPLYYDYTHYKDQQKIYKFGLDSDLEYKGRGLVEGSMLNQFSMSEKDNHLRVATTSGWSWFNNGKINNSVYTLSMVDKKLVVDGILSGLGHEGETIRGVRFLGDRGFVVTFKQTDPLYTIDMSDVKNPKVVGELSIPGYSSYLHPIDENRVLSVGRDADETGVTLGLQLQLFDISDFSNPILADKVKIGDRYTHSEAERNHKAFSYRASDLMFGIPYRTYSYSDYTHDEHFGIYRVDGLKIQSIDTITSKDSSWGDVGRGLIFDLNESTYGSLFKGSSIMCEILK